MMRSVLLFLGLLCIAVAPSAQGEEIPDDRVEIFPAFQEIVIEAGGGDETRELVVRNGTAEHLSLSLSVIDFGSLDESGGIAFLGQEADIERRYGLASWLALERDQVEVGSGGESRVAVTVENRDTLGPGGHYGAVLLRSAMKDGSEGGNGALIGVNQVFTSLFFVRKEGGAAPDLSLSGWQLPAFEFSVPRTMEVRFQNMGNIHVIPRGIVTIEDVLGRTVARGIVNPESALVFPESFRRMTVAFREEKRALLPGRYTVRIATRYDGEEEFSEVTGKIDLLLLPATLLLVALIGALGWVYARRSRRGQGERKTSERLAE